MSDSRETHEIFYPKEVVMELFDKINLMQKMIDELKTAVIYESNNELGNAQLHPPENEFIATSALEKIKQLEKELGEPRGTPLE